MDILLVESHTLHHLHSKTTQLKYDKHVCKAVKFHRQRGQPIDWFIHDWEGGCGGFLEALARSHLCRLVLAPLEVPKRARAAMALSLSVGSFRGAHWGHWGHISTFDICKLPMGTELRGEWNWQLSNGWASRLTLM